MWLTTHERGVVLYFIIWLTTHAWRALFFTLLLARERMQGALFFAWLIWLTARARAVAMASVWFWVDHSGLLTVEHVCWWSAIAQAASNVILSIIIIIRKCPMYHITRLPRKTRGRVLMLQIIYLYLAFQPQPESVSVIEIKVVVFLLHFFVCVVLTESMHMHTAMIYETGLNVSIEFVSFFSFSWCWSVSFVTESMHMHAAIIFFYETGLNVSIIKKNKKNKKLN